MEYSNLVESYKFWDVVTLWAREKLEHEVIVARVLARGIICDALRFQSINPKFLKSDRELQGYPYVGYCACQKEAPVLLRAEALEHLLAVVREAAEPSRLILTEEFIIKSDFRNWIISTKQQLPGFWFSPDERSNQFEDPPSVEDIPLDDVAIEDINDSSVDSLPNIIEPKKTYVQKNNLIGERYRTILKKGSNGISEIWKVLDTKESNNENMEIYRDLHIPEISFRDHPECDLLYENEFQIYSCLDHENIVKAHEHGIDNIFNIPYLVLDYMEGETLKDYIKDTFNTSKDNNIENSFLLLNQICAAITHVHEKGFVHSDIKPGNLYISNKNIIKLYNFSIARAANNNQYVLGALTPAYASPEMLEGLKQDFRDDVYSLGLVAYELFTGKHPFNKMPANSAKENQMKVMPIKSLTWLQNRKIRKVLSFDQSIRTTTIDAFIKGIQPAKFWIRKYF